MLFEYWAWWILFINTYPGLVFNSAFCASSGLQIRPIDKKLQYQLGKLTGGTRNLEDNPHMTQEEIETAKEEEKWLKYRPNPDLLVSKTNETPEVG